MTRHETFPLRLSTDKPISIAILAMGGQGGGVLADWIVSVAETNDWVRNPPPCQVSRNEPARRFITSRCSPRERARSQRSH